MNASAPQQEVERRFVLASAVVTSMLCVFSAWQGRHMTSNLQTDFTLGGLAMVVCWGLLAVVAEPKRRAVVRGVAGGVVLALLMLTLLAVAAASVLFVLFS
jgi:hypothetical protein